MPEGPELFLATRYVNKICSKLIFNRIEKSEITKNPAVPWNGGPFSISAVSRGKEMALRLNPVEEEIGAGSSKSSTVVVVVHFGMSGCFATTSMDAIPKHSHLRFYSNDDDDKMKKVLSFVDTRRFGRWEVKPELKWSVGRGPDPLTEYEEFRLNILNSIENSIFQKPLCEVLLDQRYFNGIGNYLRAEIMHRANIEPFSRAYDILSNLTKKQAPVSEDPPGDILYLCKSLQNEIIDLKLTPYSNPDDDKQDWSKFLDWCQVYMKKCSKCMFDRHKRMVWFTGSAGPLAPAGSKIKVKGAKKAKAAPKKSVKREISKSDDKDSLLLVTKSKMLKKETNIVLLNESAVASRTRLRLKNKK